MKYQPPFDISARAVSLVAGIAEMVGRISVRAEGDIRLRRIDRIRTIQGTLAIEGNSLGQEQVSAILEGKRVLADPREILEVKNAVKAYENLDRYDPRLCADLLQAHALMLRGLIDDAGAFRTQAAGVKRGSAVVHIENMVYQRQADYYEAINSSNTAGNATPFLEFMLEAINDTVRTVAIGSEKNTEKSSEKIVALLRADPTMTIAALATALSLSTRAVEKALQKLQVAGRIQRIGPAKGGRWSVPGESDA